MKRPYLVLKPYKLLTGTELTTARGGSKLTPCTNPILTSTRGDTVVTSSNIAL